jgi:uncharacterized membrane protein YbjE (DUF340 family)
MSPLVLYLLVAYGTFMTYLLSPTFGDDKKARTVFSALFYGTRKETLLESSLLLLIVFGGGGLAFILMDPLTAKTAVTAGLGWTSVASAGRTTYATGMRRDQS